MSSLKEFPAYAGMKTGASNGRTVIDKLFSTGRRGNVNPIWDSGAAYSAGDYVWFPDKNGDVYRALEDTLAGESPDTHPGKWDNQNPEFAGNDKPEKTVTLDGVDQVAVEKGVTNLIAEGQAQQADPNDSVWVAGSTLVPTKDYDTVFGKNVARYNESVTSGQWITRTVSLAISGDTSGRSINYSFPIRNNGGDVTTFRVLFQFLGGAEAGQDIYTSEFTIADDFQVIDFTETITQADRDGVVVRIQAREAGNLDIVLGLHMPIESAYPVLFTEGTRPAPLVPINDAIPDEGTVALVTSVVATDGFDYIFDNFGAEGSRCGVFLPDVLEVRSLTSDWKGDRSTFSEMLPVYEPFIAFNIALMHTYTNDNRTLVVMDGVGTIRRGTRAYTPTTPFDDNSVLGSRNGGVFRSFRFEIPWYSDNTVRVNATDDEIKQFFEDLTRGTSMQTKKEDMTIV